MGSGPGETRDHPFEAAHGRVQQAVLASLSRLIIVIIIIIISSSSSVIIG